jgi:hypothetical protein
MWERVYLDSKNARHKRERKLEGFVSALVVAAINDRMTTYKEDGDDGKDQHDLQRVGSPVSIGTRN